MHPLLSAYVTIPDPDYPHRPRLCFERMEDADEALRIAVSDFLLADAAWDIDPPRCALMQSRSLALLLICEIIEAVHGSGHSLEMEKYLPPGFLSDIPMTIEQAGVGLEVGLFPIGTGEFEPRNAIGFALMAYQTSTAALAAGYSHRPEFAEIHRTVRAKSPQNNGGQITQG